MGNDILNTLVAVRNTLDTIEVKGHENRDALSGCWRAIDNIIKAIVESSQKQTDSTPDPAQPAPTEGRQVPPHKRNKQRKASGGNPV